jgi:hypothetical protein
MSAEETPIVDNGICGYREPILKRAWRRILGAYYQHQEVVPPNEFELVPGKGDQPPKMAADAIMNRVQVFISFKDLIRCLLGCSLHVNTIIYCENLPGRIMSETKTFATFD